ncbi:hypothetical protein [Petrotoga sp. 9PWA.NaAc.5.4]|uniref:hypothetical protein n=1 Tax=Petrotoga sp. 9PWA.NaAc.5.4 TaxID=1434328 RepID=UPI000EFD93DB|nr:hypothetical protein [Petrotoga sp. 9PWA.NaAc.5.4]
MKKTTSASLAPNNYLVPSPFISEPVTVRVKIVITGSTFYMCPFTKGIHGSKSTQALTTIYFILSNVALSSIANKISIFQVFNLILSLYYFHHTPWSYLHVKC